MTALPASGSSAGSRRFWITVAIFALLNIGAWFGYHAWLRAQMPRQDILRVQSFAPGDGEILSVDEPATLSWTFNLDVGKPGPAAIGPKGESPATLEPAINGEWLWTDARTLTFEAHDRLPRATRFTATLNPKMLRSADGYTLGGPVKNSFSTPPLELQSIRQAAFDGQDHILLEIEFNDKVIPGEVLRHLKIEGPDGKPVAAVLHGQGAGTIVRVLTDPIPLIDPEHAPVSTEKHKHSEHGTAATQRRANALLVTLLPGLTGASGPLGITQKETREVPIANVLLADTLEASSESPAELTLTMNSSITADDFERIKPLFSMEPAIPFTAERRSWNDRTVVFHGDFIPATRYTLTIAKMKQADDARRFPRPAVLSVFVPDREPSVSFENSKGYLGSKGNRTLLLNSVNAPAVRVWAYRVYANNLVAWRNSKSRYRDPQVSHFDRPLVSRRYVLANKKNVEEQLRIDVDDLLGKEPAIEGVYAIHVAIDKGGGGENTNADEPDWMESYEFESGESALITLSDVGLTAKLMADAANPAEQSLLAWAVSLSTAAPLKGLSVRLYSDKNQLLGEGVTDDQGLVRIEHVNPAPGEKAAVLIAESAGPAGKNPSLTWLDLSTSQRDESSFAVSGRPYLRTGYEAYVWPERGVYRPGETVVLRAIVRGPALSTPEKLPVRWQMRRPDGHDWLSQTAVLDADGAAEWRITFPADAPTGYWTAEIGLPGPTGTGSSGMNVFGTAEFQVEEFIPDRMKVALALSGPGLLPKDPASRLNVTKGPLLADVQADYLFGQPGADLQSHLTVNIRPATFSTTHFSSADGWVVGDSAGAGAVLAEAKVPSGDKLEPMTQTLDKSGHTQFEADLGKKLAAFLPQNTGEKPVPDFPLKAADIYRFRGPWQITVEASATETGGRAVTAYAGAEADGLPYYLMVRPTGLAARGYVQKDTLASFELALVSPTGEKVPENAATIQTRVYRESWNNTLIYRDNRYQYESQRILEPVKDAVSRVEVTDGAAAFSWRPAAAGTYVLEFADTQTLQVTTLRLTAGESDGWNDNIDRTDPERLEVELVPADAGPAPASTGAKAGTPSFRIGQPVKAIVRSPFAGRLLLTLETDTVVWSKVVQMTGAVAEIPLTLPEGIRPNGYVAATVIRGVDPNTKWGTHRAFGISRFKVDFSDRRLVIHIAAPKEVRPGRTLDVGVAVLDASGKPAANAAVALVAVDEGILRLSDYATPNPLELYSGTRALSVETSDIYGQLMPEVAKIGGESKVGGDEGSGGFVRRHSSPVAAKRVRPVSLVSDIVHTDSQGNALVHFQVPEFLGQLRIMAVAYAGPRFGSAAAPVFVRSPLVVQTSFPRFMAPGDSADATLLVINNSPAGGVVHVRMVSGNAAVLSFGGDPADISLPAGGQKTLSVKFLAHDAAGTSAIAVEARMDDETFTEHMEIPVRPASPAISRGGYVQATPAAPLTINIPAGMLAGTAALQLRIGQRPVLGLPEGLDYLDRYPYGCLEQTTSQCFPLVYLSDIGREIAPGVFEQENVARKVQAGITRVVGMQTGTGGLSMWSGQTDPWPWGSVYAAHFLVEAEKAGYAVPADFNSRLMDYLRSLLATSAEPGAGTELQAYAAYVLTLAGHPDRATLNRLGEILDAQEKLPSPPAGIAAMRFRLALAWAAAGRTDLAEKMLPERMPSPRTIRDLGGNLASPVGDEALLITTLLTVSPHDPALPQLVERLSVAGQNHEWRSTQDNALAVMALGKYLRSTRGQTPFDSAELLDGDRVLGTAAGNKPLLWTATVGMPEKLRVRVSGNPGATAYISWLQSGVSLAMPGDADHALKLRRVYLTEGDKPLDVAGVVAGTAVKVRVTIDSPVALSNLVIEDLLPAGLEIENPRLATSEKKSGDAAGPAEISPQRLDIRDDRIVMVADVASGTSTWSYLARAVTPGSYVIPPVRGECMYDPAINSIFGGGGRMIVSTGPGKLLAQK